eukprot:GHVT01081314.1.p2 GENE.GHVT01081314.1~~GHVT01081314.1.p2  ORF type:complete len:389 (-),score=76.31 GHVT01081314.1:1954-3120(-)
MSVEEIRGPNGALAPEGGTSSIKTDVIIQPDSKRETAVSSSSQALPDDGKITPPLPSYAPVAIASPRGSNALTSPRQDVAADGATSPRQGAFEELEREFQEVLQELVGEKSLEHFRLEYEKLHKALKLSHESERRLIKKCRELNFEIVSNAAKVQTALKLSQEDQASIMALKKEIERAWKMVEASQEKEQRARETVDNLKVEIANLSRLVEQGAGLSINQENTVNDLLGQKEELLSERDKLARAVEALTSQNTKAFAEMREAEQERSRSESEVSSLKVELQSTRLEVEREQRQKSRLDVELKELRSNLEEKLQILSKKQAQISQDRKEMSQLQEQLHELRKTSERLTRQTQEDRKYIEEKQEELKTQSAKVSKMSNEKQLRMVDILPL